MRRTLARLSPALQLARITTAFGAVASVWFVILWTRACPEEPGTPTLRELPLWLLLAAGAVNSIGLFAFTTALNDLLDRRRDQTLNPERPLPSGRISVEDAVLIVVLTLATAVLGATILGTMAVVLTLVVAGAALFFNAAGKHIPAVGLIVLGLMYAGQMVTPNLHLRFVLPVWLVMTHGLLVAAAAHAFGKKSPGISPRAAAFAIAGWAFWSTVMFAFGLYRNWGEGGLLPTWVHPAAYLGPSILALGFCLLTCLRVRTLGRGPRTSEKISRYGELWLSLYATSWLFGQGYKREGIILGVLSAIGFLGMTVLKELYAVFEQPLDYRRV